MIALKKSITAITCLLFSATLLLAASVGDGAWRSRVPEKDRVRENPYDSQASAVAAGAKLFQQNCSSCHGSEATGTEKKTQPSQRPHSRGNPGRTGMAAEERQHEERNAIVVKAA